MFLGLLPLYSGAQEKATPLRSIYAEVNGPNIVSLNYDSRIHGHSGWGYRVGVGYNRNREEDNSLIMNGNTSVWNGWSERTQGVTVPLEVNYLLGRRQHKFEAGAGATLGVFREYSHLHSLFRVWGRTLTAPGGCWRHLPMPIDIRPTSAISTPHSSSPPISASTTVSVRAAPSVSPSAISVSKRRMAGPLTSAWNCDNLRNLARPLHYTKIKR